MKHIERLHISTYTHTITQTHTYFFFFLIGSISQSSGKLARSSQLPLLQPALGDWHGVRGHFWVNCSPCTSTGEGRNSPTMQTPASEYRSGGRGSPPGASQPQAMQGLGHWDGQAKHAPACPTPKHCAALPGDSRDFFSDWGKGQGPGGVTQSPPALFCRGSRDHPASKSYAWPPTLARLNPGDIN